MSLRTGIADFGAARRLRRRLEHRRQSAPVAAEAGAFYLIIAPSLPVAGAHHRYAKTPEQMRAVARLRRLRRRNRSGFPSGDFFEVNPQNA
jgi:hypothetical protein